MRAPAVVEELVERFESHREAYRSGKYNETQLRRDFLDPFFKALGWDVHNEGLQKQHLLIDQLDRAFSTLLVDLEAKRLLEKTLVVISCEFGRPGQFDAGGGRGHPADAFSGVLAGGGLRTGRVIGQTDELAMRAEGRRVSVPDWFATLYAALGINYREELYAGDRPVPITDRGQPIAELFA